MAGESRVAHPEIVGIMISLAYKPNAAAVLERLRTLFARNAPDRIFAAIQVPSPALEEFGRQYPEGFCDYPDPEERIAFWDRLLAERAQLEDDSIPSAYLSEMDQGLYGAIFGGEIRFMAHPENGWISSMVPPLLEDWPEFDALQLDPSSLWFNRYLRQLDVFARGSKGKFGVSHFILIDGLNFAFELVGATKTYLGLEDCPELVRRVIDFAFDLNVRVQESFFDVAPALEGGTASNMVEWIPGRIVSESVDPFHMTSVQHFETWGREPVERIFGRFDGGVLHLHGNGRHLLEAVCTIQGLKAIFLGDDKGYPPAFEILDPLRRRAGDVPLVVQVEDAALRERLSAHTLTGGVLYKVQGVADVAAANRLMEEVRAYRL
jgi:hypothetical protein